MGTGKSLLQGVLGSSLRQAICRSTTRKEGSNDLYRFESVLPNGSNIFDLTFFEDDIAMFSTDGQP
jgi:hypothetical protein